MALTFGDKPAPAMAQIALHKTVQESQATISDVAEVLTNSVYMDNIQRLSQDIDGVLVKGRFSTKGWISNKEQEGYFYQRTGRRFQMSWKSSKEERKKARF